jgi:WD40 repeat protein
MLAHHGVVQYALAPAVDYQVEIYDLKSQRRIAEYTGGISAMAFSPDSKTLAVSGILGMILLDPHTGNEIAKGP